MDEDLHDRVALITGAGGGIGSALVLAFSRSGADVAGLDVNEAAVHEACSAAPGRTYPICVDVASETGVEEAVKAVEERFGHIDILVNTAAIAIKAPVVSFSVEDWDLTMRVNLRGTFLMCRAVLPGMIERRHGRIINFSSIDARKARAGGSAYSATKFGILGFTEALADEVTQYDITVNSILPAGVATPMWAQFHPDADPSLVATPEDMVGIVLFLASKAGHTISGASIDVFAKRLVTRSYL